MLPSQVFFFAVGQVWNELSEGIEKFEAFDYEKGLYYTEKEKKRKFSKQLQQESEEKKKASSQRKSEELRKSDVTADRSRWSEKR